MTYFLCPTNKNNNNENNVISKRITPFMSQSVLNCTSFVSNNNINGQLRGYGEKENNVLTANPWIIYPNTSANAQLGYSMEAVKHSRSTVKNNDTITSDMDAFVQLLNLTYDKPSSETDNKRDWRDFDLQSCTQKVFQTQLLENEKDKSNVNNEKEKKEESSRLQQEEKKICDTNDSTEISVGYMEAPITISTSHQVIKRHCDVSDKKYACKICGKKYKYESNLVTHAAVHTERALECEYCHKKFGRKTNYVEHLRIHTNERPYKCRYCGKSFKQNHGWRDHERTHTNERPHVCEVCGKGFTVGHNLTVHKRIHTGEKPYTCDLCGKRFRQKSAYNAHMKNVHKTVNKTRPVVPVLQKENK